MAEFWNPTSGGRPVDDADLQLVTVMPLHAVTAMYGEQGCGPGSPLTTESIARLIASIVWHFDSLALRLFNQNPGSRRRVLPGIHGDVLMINRRTCFPDHVAHVAHDQRPDIWVDVIGEDKQQVVVAFWPGEPGCPRAGLLPARRPQPADLPAALLPRPQGRDEGVHLDRVPGPADRRPPAAARRERRAGVGQPERAPAR